MESYGFGKNTISAAGASEAMIVKLGSTKTGKEILVFCFTTENGATVVIRARTYRKIGTFLVSLFRFNKLL